jgi:2-oxoglutarate ferredoxin oxidoreductase subunit gamma
MLKWQKKKSISLQKAKAMDHKELEDRIVTGIFINEKRIEFVDAYDTVARNAQNIQSGKTAPVDSTMIPSQANAPIQKLEIRFAGAGGQGIVLAAVILSEAAGIYEGREVVQTQSYGVEARGGASRAEVIISDEEIVFPEIVTADILIAMNTPSLNKFSESLRENGMLIYNSSSIEKPSPIGSLRVYGIPLGDLAREAGKEIAGNMAALGALVGLTKIVSEASVEQAMAKRIPPGTEVINLKAFKLGLSAARSISGD